MWSLAPGAFDLLGRSQNSSHLVYEQVDQIVWADGIPGKVVNIQPIKINLKEGAWTPWNKEYPFKEEALEKIQTALQKFLKSGLIWSCQYLYNIPILPVKKPHSD